MRATRWSPLWFTFAAVVATVGLALPTSTAVPPPGKVSFQGMVADGEGTPLDGPVDMVFRFYDDPAAGTLLWEETHNAGSLPPAVSVSAGLFTISLGDPAHRTGGSEPLFESVFANHGAAYLGLQVADDPEMSPRISIASSPFAVNAQSLEGKPATDFAESVHTHTGAQITGPVDSATDADTLDGQHAVAFAGAVHDHDASAIATGTLPAGRGGTGLSSPGASGNLLTSTGTAWASVAPPTAGALGAVVDAADTTLIRSGSGTTANPFKLALNIANANTWTGEQTFSANTYFPGGGVWTDSGRVGIGIDSPAAMLHLWRPSSTKLRMECNQDNMGSELEFLNMTPTPLYLGGIRFRDSSATRMLVAFRIPGGLQFISGSLARLSISEDGKIGIGTSDPGFPLTFQSTLGQKVSLYTNTSNPDICVGFGVQSNLLQIHSDVSYSDIAFGYGSSASFTERMRVKGDGNVGIGTSAPAYKLDVAGDANLGSSDAFNKLFMKGKEAVWTDGNYFSWGFEGTANYFRSNVGIGVTPPGYPLTFANVLGDKISLYTHSATEVVGFGVQGNLLQIHSDTPSSDIAFGHGSSTALTETMRIKGNGRVGIGLAYPSYQLQLSTDSAAKPGTNTWTVASDMRLKKDVAPFTEGLAVLEKIRPIRYRYNGLAGTPAGMACIGVSAQELLEVAPYTVGTFRAKLTEQDAFETELYDFNSHALTFLLINAVKELDGKVAALSETASPADREQRKGTAPSTLPEGTSLKSPLEPHGAEAPAGSPAVPPAPSPLPYLAASWPICEVVDAGDLLVTDPDHPGHLCRSAVPNDPGVVGVVTLAASPSTDPGSASATAAHATVALAGMVQMKVDAGYGAIALNDLLVASPTPGHAMRAQAPAPGTVVGKALEPLQGGTGLLWVLVMSR